MVIFAPPSPYNRTTLDSIRAMVKQCRSTDAIAEALGWTVEELRSRARNHGIALSVEPPPSHAEIAPISAAKVARSMPQRAPGRFRQRSDHPRSKYLSISVSEACLEALG